MFTCVSIKPEAEAEGGANRTKGAFRAAEANCHNHANETFCHVLLFFLFLLILAQLKHQRFGALLPQNEKKLSSFLILF